MAYRLPGLGATALCWSTSTPSCLQSRFHNLPIVPDCGSPRQESFQRLRGFVTRSLNRQTLLPGRDMHKYLCYSDTILDQQMLELIDLVVTSAPFTLCGKALDALDQDPPIPRPVENHDLTVLRKFFPESLQVVLASFVRGRCGNRMNFETARVQSPSKSSHDATLAGCIPALKHNNGPLDAFPDTLVAPPEVLIASK